MESLRFIKFEESTPSEEGYYIVLFYSIDPHGYYFFHTRVLYLEISYDSEISDDSEFYWYNYDTPEAEGLVFNSVEDRFVGWLPFDVNGTTVQDSMSPKSILEI